MTGGMGRAVSDRMNTATIDPCAWDITMNWEDGALVGVSVKRTDGHYAAFNISPHVVPIAAGDKFRSFLGPMIVASRVPFWMRFSPVRIASWHHRRRDLYQTALP